MPRLREQIAGDAPGSVGVDDVLVTAGAAPALFIVATALLEAGDHLLIEEPNYATNLETPRTLGADVEPIPLRFEDGWQLDLDLLESRLRPETKLISVTYPHNPTGAMIDRATLERLIAIVEAHPQRPPAGRRDLPRAGLRRSAARSPPASRSGRSASRRCRRPTACPACGSAG